MRAQPTRSQIIGFRLAGHGFAASCGEGVCDAAGRSGVQNSPPGSAILSLHARTGGVTREEFTHAIADERSLLQTWSLRGAPYVFPTAAAALFTAGVLPPTEEAARRFLPGVVPSLDALGLSLGDTADRVGGEIGEVLAGRALDIHELGREIAPRIAARLTRAQRTHWNSEGPHAAGQTVGEAVVHFCVRILTLRGTVCIAPREEHRARFVLVTEHLGSALPEVDPQLARAELLRRYLRCYGPATRADFAGWLGVGSRDAAAWWDLVAAELAPVDTDSGERWLLAEDLPALAAAELPGPTDHAPLLLPPGDPYLRVPDRETIVTEERQAAVWRAVGGPGALLVGGEIVGTWRPRKRGARLTITVAPFEPLSRATRAAVTAAAAGVGPLRGAEQMEVVVDSPAG